MKINRLLMTGLSLTFVLTSCRNKKKEVEENVPNFSGYIVGLRAQTGANTEADYMLTHSDLMSGTISSTGRGIEQTGWCYYGVYNNRYFSFNYDLNECIGYDLDGSSLREAGRFVFERMDCINKIEGDNSKFLAIGAPWGGGSFDCQIQIVDANDISIHKNVKTPIYTSYDKSGTRMNAWPTYSYVQNEKLYISFYPLNGVSWETPNTDTCYVSVYSYPDLKYIKTFKDTRTGPIGYYASQPCIMADEAGNHYTISSSSLLGGFTQSTKPSGILKINKNEDEFDANYFFDIESSGYKLMEAAYVGNGLAVGRVSVLTDEVIANQWGAFYSKQPFFKLVVLNLNTKTITPVTGVPGHGGQYQTPLYVENGKVYLSINNLKEAYVYSVDPTTATGTRGAKIEGNELQAMIRVN